MLVMLRMSLVHKRRRHWKYHKGRTQESQSHLPRQKEILDSCKLSLQGKLWTAKLTGARESKAETGNRAGEVPDRSQCQTQTVTYLLLCWCYHKI